MSRCPRKLSLWLCAICTAMLAGCGILDSEEGIPADQFNGVWEAAHGNREYTFIFQGVGTPFSSRRAQVWYTDLERGLAFPVNVEFDHPEISVRGAGSERRSPNEGTATVDSTSIYFSGEFVTGDDLRMEGTLADTTYIYQYEYDDSGAVIDSSVITYEDTFPVTFRKQTASSE